MSDKSSKREPEHERYAYSITRKLFGYTLLGTLLFAGIMIALWYVM